MLQPITFQTSFLKKFLKHSNKGDSPFFHLHTCLGPTLGTTTTFLCVVPHVMPRGRAPHHIRPLASRVEGEQREKTKEEGFLH